MQVEYLTHMGDDKFVANVARVSFNKWVDKFGPNEQRIISFLAEHNHWSPFGHPHISLRLKAPVYVARQIFKSKIGFVENEVSRRYVDEEPEFFWPSKWRKRAPNKKQGSLDEEVKYLGGGAYPVVTVQDRIDSLEDYVLTLYQELIEEEVAPELARSILPQAMMTQWVLTGSLAAYARMYKLRAAKDAQLETQELAKMIGEIIQPLFPVSWDVLTK